ALQRLAKTGPQRLALAAPLGMADQRHRQPGDDRSGVVDRAVVDHDHVAAVRQHAFQEVADRERLVEAGQDHERADGGFVQGVISMSSDNPDDSGNRRRDVVSAANRCNSASACALAGLSPATPGSASPPSANRSSMASPSARPIVAPAEAPGASTSATPKASVVRVISTSGPDEATSQDANNTGLPSAHAKTAASSNPDAKLRWCAVTALDAAVHPVAIVQYPAGAFRTELWNRVGDSSSGARARVSHT